MRKRQEVEVSSKITVGIKELQSMLSVGRGTAERTAEAAGAVIRLGKRKLYNLEKITAYIDQLGA